MRGECVVVISSCRVVYRLRVWYELSRTYRVSSDSVPVMVHAEVALMRRASTMHASVRACASGVAPRTTCRRAQYIVGGGIEAFRRPTSDATTRESECTDFNGAASVQRKRVLSFRTVLQRHGERDGCEEVPADGAKSVTWSILLGFECRFACEYQHITDASI